MQTVPKLSSFPFSCLELEEVLAGKKFRIKNPSYAQTIYSLCSSMKQGVLYSDTTTVPLTIAFLDYCCRPIEDALLKITDWINNRLEKLALLIILSRLEPIAHDRENIRRLFQQHNSSDRAATQLDNMAGALNMSINGTGVLDGFDLLLEGVLIESRKSIAVASIVPRRFSQLYSGLRRSSTTTDTTLESLIRELCALISRSLQDDMFSLYVVDDASGFRTKL